MNTARANFGMALLSTGQVLVAGGDGGGTSAELYTPTTGKWTTTGSLHVVHSYASATLLQSGMVLLAGSNTTAELYTPTTGKWTTTGSLHVVRSHFAMALLNSGTVLAAGGYDSTGNAVASAELYTPATGTWTLTGSMHVSRDDFTTTLLTSGLCWPLVAWRMLSQAAHRPARNSTHHRTPASTFSRATKPQRARCAGDWHRQHPSAGKSRAACRRPLWRNGPLTHAQSLSSFAFASFGSTGRSRPKEVEAEHAMQERGEWPRSAARDALVRTTPESVMGL